MTGTKVVLDARHINGAGIGVYIKALAAYLYNRTSLTVLIRKNELGAYDWEKDVEIVAASSPIYSAAEQWELLKKIPGCDVFIAPNYNIPLFPIKARHRITFIHDIYHKVNYKNLTLPQKIYNNIMMRAALGFSDKIITVSEFSKREILSNYRIDAGKILVAYCGVDEERFKKYENRQALERVKLKYGLPDKFILFVGSVKPHKNLINLVKAYEEARREVPEYKLVITGKKEGMITADNELFSFVEKNERLNKEIIFTGYIQEEDLPLIYNSASLLAFPSIYEGFGLPPVEAMACGCPVVSSNAASLPEVCGKGAFYFNPYSVSEIAGAITKTLADERLRNELIQKGYENVKRFSWNRSNKLIYDAITHMAVNNDARNPK